MKDSVKTEAKAIEILNDFLNKQLNDDNLDASTRIDEVEMECECGQTSGMRAMIEGGSEIAYVSICDICGSDDHLWNDVLEISK